MAIRPWEIDRQRGGSTPRTGLFGAPQNPYAEASAQPMSPQQALAQTGVGPLGGGQPGPRRPIETLTRRPDPRDMPDPGPQPSTAGVSRVTFEYPSVLPPLSPEAQRAFAERRRAATRAEEEARAQVDRQRQMAEAAAVQGRRQIAREQAEESRAGMAEFASRGVARSPLFVNPFQRGVARAAQERVGELEMGLSQTLENLGAALQRAQVERARELAQIETDIMAARSNVPMILGVS